VVTLVDLFRVLHELTTATRPGMTQKSIQLPTDPEDEIIDLPVTAYALLPPPGDDRAPQGHLASLVFLSFLRSPSVCISFW